MCVCVCVCVCVGELLKAVTTLTKHVAMILILVKLALFIKLQKFALTIFASCFSSKQRDLLPLISLPIPNFNEG